MTSKAYIVGYYIRAHYDEGDIFENILCTTDKSIADKKLAALEHRLNTVVTPLIETFDREDKRFGRVLRTCKFGEEKYHEAFKLNTKILESFKVHYELNNEEFEWLKDGRFPQYYITEVDFVA